MCAALERAHYRASAGPQLPAPPILFRGNAGYGDPSEAEAARTPEGPNADAGYFPGLTFVRPTPFQDTGALLEVEQTGSPVYTPTPGATPEVPPDECNEDEDLSLGFDDDPEDGPDEQRHDDTFEWCSDEEVAPSESSKSDVDDPRDEDYAPPHSYVQGANGAPRKRQRRY